MVDEYYELETGIWKEAKLPFCIFSSLCLDSAVGIATGYGLDDRGVGVRTTVGSRIFLFMSSRPVLEPTQPLIQ
jgi:hypothetical protein